MPRYEYIVWLPVPCPLGCRVVHVVAEEKIACRTYDRSCCTCGYRSCARTIRRRDRGYALPLCGLPPRHTVLSLAPGWPVDSITAQSVPSAYLKRHRDTIHRTPLSVLHTHDQSGGPWELWTSSEDARSHQDDWLGDL